MLTRTQLEQYLKELLQTDNFQDYCPNGLQVEGKNTINNIVSGVSANLEFIEKAIQMKADAVLVHHGFFWKNELPQITHYKYKRIKTLMQHDINLFAYHLPLDAHPTLGNNIQLAHKLQIKNPSIIPQTLIWQGEVKLNTDKFIGIITKECDRVPQVFGNKKYIDTIAWCTGGAQNMITDILDLSLDCYLSGEVSEQTPALATENNLLYISAGHHATERYGVQALGEHLATKFGITHQFIDVYNSV